MVGILPGVKDWWYSSVEPYRNAIASAVYPALTLSKPLLRSTLYSKVVKTAYSIIWAVFLTMKSCQLISEEGVTGLAEKVKITPAQTTKGNQYLRR